MIVDDGVITGSVGAFCVLPALLINAKRKKPEIRPLIALSHLVYRHIKNKPTGKKKTIRSAMTQPF
jgi:hypothetical protein